MKPILDVKNLTKDFGGLRAIDSLDIKIFRGEIVALIGPNGAGKTTFFNCITGIYKPTNGEVAITHPKRDTEIINDLVPNVVVNPLFRFLPESVLKSLKKYFPQLLFRSLKPNEITERGMARTFQNIRLFKNMTVLENVMIGRHCRTNAGIPGAVIRGPGTKKEEKEVIEECYRLLKKTGLDHLSDELAKNLPYGDQRRLEIARALATEPFLLLLDEPAAGMNPQETKELVDLIYRIRDEDKISILLIEHDMKLVMELSERIYVVDYGKGIATGTPKEISENPVVIKAYLGEDIEDA